MLGDETLVLRPPETAKVPVRHRVSPMDVKEMQKMILCEGCREPMVLIGIGSGEERMQDVTCEHCGMLFEVSWPINGSPEVRAESKPQ